MLIDVLNSFPFDYCYNVSTGVMFDDSYTNQCAYGQRYVVEDGTTSFFVCYNPNTRQMYHLNSPDECTFGILVAFVDLRGDITKYACVEENLNPEECDIIPASAPQNEIRQLSRLENTAFGFQDCLFQIEFDGAITGFPSFSCADPNETSPAAIQAALESLPTIGAGNVIVTSVNPNKPWVSVPGGPLENTTVYRVEFVNALGGQDIEPEIIFKNFQSFAGGSDSTVIDGGASSPGFNNVMPGGTVQIFQAGPATDPHNPATYGPEVTAGPQPVDASGKVEIFDLIEGDYVVCADGTGSVRPSCEVVAINDNELLIVNNVDLPGTITAEITDTTGTNEVQFIRQCSSFCRVDGGSFTITVDGQPTGNLPANATKTEVENALELLPNITGVIVTGDDFALGSSPGKEMQIEFAGALGSQDVPQLTLTTSLTGTGFALFYEAGTVTEGSGGVQTLTLDNRVSGGTFTLTFDNGTASSTTGPIAWDATVGEVEAALNALPSINSGGGSVTVSTTSTDPAFPPEDTKITAAPFEVNFTGVANADTNVLIVDNTNLE